MNTATTSCIPQQRLQKLARSQKGAALIEFALILPLFLLLLFGLVTFSVALYDKTVLTMATREGARAGSIFVPGRTSAVIANTATAATSQACQDNFITFGRPTTPVPQATVQGDILTVTATGNYTGLYIFPDLTISAKTIMRIE